MKYFREIQDPQQYWNTIKINVGNKNILHIYITYIITRGKWELEKQHEKIKKK